MGEVNVNVIPHWYKRAMLSMEFTDTNIMLLLRAPNAPSSPPKPHDSNLKPQNLPEGIYWNSTRGALYTWWRDEEGTWHVKSRAVRSVDGDMDSAAATAVEFLLEFHANYHVPYVEADPNGEEQTPFHEALEEHEREHARASSSS